VGVLAQEDNGEPFEEMMQKLARQIPQRLLQLRRRDKDQVNTLTSEDGLIDVWFRRTVRTPSKHFSI
jgi:hypothetical protein